MKNSMLTLIMLLTTGCMADIRPEPLAAVETPTSDAETRGRQLLDRAAELQGVDAFRGYDTYQMTVTDTWKGLLARAGNPWPQSKVHVRLSYRANSFDGRAEFLEGNKNGWTWGLQSWRAYEISPDGDLEFRKNKDASFILPALQYLTEWVFRDHRGQVVSYAGEQTIDGTSYQRVYVTWNDMEPTKNHDQYVAFIDTETGMLSKLHYTIREFAGFVTGTVHYGDFRDVAGVKMPFRQSITAKPTNSPDKYLHRVEATKVEFGVPALASFKVKEGLVPLGDEKLAQR